MRAKRTGLQFRVELRSEEKRMFGARQLGDFHQVVIRRKARKNEAVFCQGADMRGIHFVTMAMALGNKMFAVRAERDGSGGERCGICSEPHGCAVIFGGQILLLFRHNIDHRMRRLGIDLRGIRPVQPRDVPREFDDSKLHAVTKPEIGDAVFPAIPDCRNLALNAARTEPPGNDDAVVPGKSGEQPRIFFEFFAVDPFDSGLAFPKIRRMLNGLEDGDIRIGKHEISRIEIFSDDADAHCPLMLRGNIRRGAGNGARNSSPLLEITGPRTEF